MENRWILICLYLIGYMIESAVLEEAETIVKSFYSYRRVENSWWVRRSCSQCKGCLCLVWIIGRKVFTLIFMFEKWGED